jgi:hypothetical protein
VCLSATREKSRRAQTPAHTHTKAYFTFAIAFKVKEMRRGRIGNPVCEEAKSYVGRKRRQLYISKKKKEKKEEKSVESSTTRKDAVELCTVVTLTKEGGHKMKK